MDRRANCMFGLVLSIALIYWISNDISDTNDNLGEAVLAEENDETWSKLLEMKLKLQSLHE